MEMGVKELQSNRTMMTDPTNVLDTSGNKETVEVGVIVIGLCCICLVACALVFLQLRSNNRHIRGNRQRSANLDGGSGDQTRDPLDIEAPPSYDAVIRSPHLYPPSRRNSMTLGVSDRRRSSDFSTFSLSLQSPRFIHQPRQPQMEASEDNLSLYSGTQLAGNQAEDTEEPPPPYPGNIVMISPRNARSMDYICNRHSSTAGQRTRNLENELEVRNENAHCSDGSRGRASRSSQRHIACLSRNHVVNAWSDTESRTSRNQRNEPGKTHGCHSNANTRNLAVNIRDTITSRTFVSHSARGPEEAASTTRTSSSENLQDLGTL